MKTLTIFVILLAISSLATAQWRNAYKGEQILAFGVHDSNLFIGINPPDANDAIVWRLDSLSPYVVWETAQNGMDESQGLVTSFASLGNYVFAGMTYYQNGIQHGAGAGWRSSDDGGDWSLTAGGDLLTNGVYLYSYFHDGTHGIYVSRDSGFATSWVSIANFPLDGLASIGMHLIAVNSKNTWVSKDTGIDWISLPAPPVSGPIVTMGSQLFIRGMYELAESPDSGTSWNVIYVDSAGLRLSINCLATDGKNLFAGTPKGVYLSTDIGKSWQPENTGLAYQNISTMCVFDSLLFIDVSNMPGGVPYAAYDRPISEMVGNSAVKEGPIPGDTIALYPNPATGIVTVRSGRTPIVSIRVLNILGEERLALSNQYTSSLSFDLSTFASGTYFIEIQTENGTVQRKIVRE